jgi:hypothetical protein
MTSEQAKQSEVEPHVAIFWLFEGKLIIDSTPLSEAEPYGDALTHATGHIDYWSAQQKRGVIASDVEYEEPPRGRVGYDKREDRFFVRADKCILNRQAVVQKILAALNLPVGKTSTGIDPHYRCARCLERTEDRG